MSRCTMLTAVRSAKKKGQNIFVWIKNKKCSTVDCLSYVQLLRKTVAPPNLQLMSINIPR
jgi:hypothetical protein